MRYFATIILTLLTLIAQGQVNWSEAQITPLGEHRYRLTIEAQMQEGWHIYELDQRENGPLATSLTLTLPSGGKLLGATTADQEPTIIEDSALGMSLGYFGGTLTLSQEFALTTAAETIELKMEWMACNDMSCSPPDFITQTVAMPAATPHPSSALWLIILEAILWGFAALLTPCIFPMIPMTISYFIKGEHSLRSALLYGLFIVLLYTLPIAVIISATYLFGGESVTANIFNWVATHWLPNVLFFAIFIIFAASFFGLFELRLPSKWINQSDRRAERSSIGGVFFLALTLVLVSFSCTGPIVGSVLIKSTSGQIWEPIVTMLAFSIAFALPFVVVSLAPRLLEELPKSGGWLSTVKITLGFIELALAFKFLSVADQSYQWGLLNRDIYLVIWIAIFSLLSFYLLGKINFNGDSEQVSISFPRSLAAIASLCFAIYMVPGLWGAPLRPLAGYLPPIESQSFNLSQIATPTATKREVKHSENMKRGFANNLDGFYDVAQAQEYARSVGKPLLIDFTGHGCVNCRNMEQRVWSDERVDELLRNEYVVVALYMDDRTPLPESEQVTTSGGRKLTTLGAKNAHYALERYGVNSQPYYILQDSDGEQLTPARGYDLSVEGYIEFLERGIEQFRAKNIEKE